MDDILEVAKRPAVTTRRDVNILDLCDMMVAENVGAVAVVDGDRLVGIVSERDVMTRVIAKRRDLATTTVGDVMTPGVRTAHARMTAHDALQMMNDGRFRHLPIVDDEQRVIGMLSVRHLLRLRVDELYLTNVDLVNYISADGPGG